MARKIKINFRIKRDSRGTVKVFTTKRIPGQRSPRQFHLGYICNGPTIDEHSRKRIERKAAEIWSKYFGTENIDIDWDDAEAKWTRRLEPKQRRVDRTRAQKKIFEWAEKDPKFWEGYNRLPAILAADLRQHDFQDIQLWWTEAEAPRLFYSFERFLDRKEPPEEPTPLGFLEYLLGNIRQGWAKASYLRHTGHHPTVSLDTF